ncbi:hypothetical protein TNCV_4165671 [Trichonephila clavipes]|nr:hypothetical protein TNCV_4165671 [Trichonephila clavipes]
MEREVALEIVFTSFVSSSRPRNFSKACRRRHSGEGLNRRKDSPVGVAKGGCSVRMTQERRSRVGRSTVADVILLAPFFGRMRRGIELSLLAVVMWRVRCQLMCRPRHLKVARNY